MINLSANVSEGTLRNYVEQSVPAFFSCNVISRQSTFIRSLNCIHNSACSCGGIDSHLFSIPASVGFEIAWADRVDCRDWLVTGACVWWLAAKVGARARAEVWKDRDEDLSARVHCSTAVEEPAIRGFKEGGIIVNDCRESCSIHV